VRIANSLQVVLALVLAAALGSARGEPRRVRDQAPPGSRPHSVTITEFGAVGDGKTINTVPFQNAVFYLRSFADKGGAQLYVPKGRWLTGSFNLTSHLTLFLENGAVIVGTQVVPRICILFARLSSLSCHQHEYFAVPLVGWSGLQFHRSVLRHLVFLFRVGRRCF